MRGRVADELTPDTTNRIGQAFAEVLLEHGESEVVVAGDVRLSTDALRAALAAGLSHRGLHVVDIGTVPTPVMYFATETIGIPSGIVVTGSHNPPDMNGLKFVLNKKSYSGDELQNLYERTKRIDTVAEATKIPEQRNVLDSYAERICQDIKIAHKLRIGIDCGNGVTGLIAPQLFRELGCEVVALYAEPDGTFPNHHPDPIKLENLKDLEETVRTENLDLGIAFDGDGDRLGVVAPETGPVHTDQLLAMFSESVLKRSPGSHIVFDVKCGKVVRDTVAEYGGVPVLCKTGHTNIKRMVREKNAPLGGEFSGHVCFADRWFGFDDALYNSARLLELMTVKNSALTELVTELPKFHSTPELILPIPDDVKFQAVQRLIEESQFADGVITTLDGIRVDYADGWGLVRASNTGPNLTLRFEGDTEGAQRRVIGVFERALANIGIEFSVPT